jgi:hypothetical protein
MCKFIRREEACGVPAAEQLRETTGQTFRTGEQKSDGLTTFWDDPKTARETISPTFHTHTGEKFMQFEDAEQPRVRLINFG